MALANHRIRVFKNVAELEQFINTQALAPVLTGGTQTFAFTFGAAGETIIIEGSVDGGLTWTAFRRTFTVVAAGPHAAIANLLSEINTAGQWDGGTLPSADGQFTVANTGDDLTITGTDIGPEFALRVSSASTAIGAVSDEDILLAAGAVARGGKGSVALSTVEHLLTDDHGDFILVYTVP